LLPSVGIAEKEIDLNWSLYPNPAESAIHLKWDVGIDVQLVQVIDMQGRIVERNNMPFGNSYSLQVTNWPAGIYSVVISNNTQQWVKTFEKK
jgi:hypothetical protein